MTREEAIEVLKLVDENASCDDCLYYAQMEDCPTDEDCIIRQALDMAIKALQDIEQIRRIINAPVYIQEDVIRYKMICEVVK